MSCVAVPSGSVFSPTKVHKSSGCLSPTYPKLKLHGPPSSPRSPSGPASPKTPNSSSLSLRLHRLSAHWESERERERESLVARASQCPVPVADTGAVLKRKRPARISIPVAVPSLCFGVNTPKPVEKEVEVDGDGYSVYCKMGARGVMEDRYSAIVGIEGDSRQAFFGVFDGHGGAQAAEFAAKNMDKNIIDQVKGRCEDEMEMAIQEAYLATDAEFLKNDANGGTCCLTTLVREGNLVVSNAGDCRAVMSRGGTAEALTTDHRPSIIEERDRIQNSGGYVDCCRGVWRIQGSLAVSRGIGDRHLKEWVIAEPETKVMKINTECEFLILASDGLWDKVGNQEAVDVARPFCVGVDRPESLSACKQLADLSVTRGCIDDISVMIVRLERFAS